MKFEIDFSPLPDYVLIKTEGKASVEGFDDIFEMLVSSPKWKDGTAQLIDHRNIIVKDFSSEEMRRLVDLVREYTKKHKPGPCAFVVKDDLAFGIARMYEILGGEGLHPAIEIFHTIKEATEWLKGFNLHSP